MGETQSLALQSVPKSSAASLRLQPAGAWGSGGLSAQGSVLRRRFYLHFEALCVPESQWQIPEMASHMQFLHSWSFLLWPGKKKINPNRLSMDSWPPYCWVSDVRSRFLQHVDVRD